MCIETFKQKEDRVKVDELILHIGQSKTGTTTLQKTMSSSSSILLECGVFFPDTFRNEGNAIMLGHHLFDPDYFEKARQSWLNVSREQGIQVARGQWQTIVGRISQDNPTQVLVSSEFFFCRFDDPFMLKAKSCFDEVAQKTKIVIYLRSPAKHFLSNLQEALKVKRSRPLAVTKRDSFQEIISQWEKHFPGSVALNIFDPFSLHEGDIVTDFVHRYLPTVNSIDIRTLKKRENVSLSAEAMAILLDLSVGKIEEKYNTQVMVNLIRGNDKLVPNPTKPKLYPNVIQSINNWRAFDLLWLRKFYEFEFPDITYSELEPDSYKQNYLAPHTIEDICPVDATRKAALLRKAKFKYRLPNPFRRWAARW
jgi:hypothetical protein